MPGRYLEKVVFGTEATKLASNPEAEAPGMRLIRPSIGG
jgi:hypothetical protein